MPKQEPTMGSRPRRDPNRTFTIAEIEEAAIFSAYMVEAFGEAYAWIMDRLFAELDAARKRGGSPTERAARILDDAEADGRLAAYRIRRKR